MILEICLDSTRKTLVGFVFLFLVGSSRSCFFFGLFLSLFQPPPLPVTVESYSSSVLSSPLIPLLYMLVMSSNLGFFIEWPAFGQPDNDRCVENEPFIWPSPSQPRVGQLTPSNFIAVAAATAALCCSTVPPDSKTRPLFRFASGQPEALQQIHPRFFVKKKDK